MSRPGPGFGPSSAGSGDTLPPLPQCVVFSVLRRERGAALSRVCPDPGLASAPPPQAAEIPTTPFPNDAASDASDPTTPTWPDPSCKKTVRLGKHWLFNRHLAPCCCPLAYFGDALGGRCCWKSMTDLNAAAADATALTWPDPCCTKTVRLGKHWLFNPHWTSRCGLLDCFGDARGGPCFWNSTTDLNAAASNSTMPTWPDPGCKQLSGWENIGCSTLTGPPPAADSWMALETPGEGRATGTRRQTSTLLLQMLLQMLLQRLRRLLRTLPLDTAWVVCYVSQREPLHPGGVAWSRVCPDPGLASAPPPQAAEIPSTPSPNVLCYMFSSPTPPSPPL